jgi:hypothetical protein
MALRSHDKLVMLDSIHSYKCNKSHPSIFPLLQTQLLAWIAKSWPEPDKNALQTAGFPGTARAGVAIQQSKKAVFDCSPTGC